MKISRNAPCPCGSGKKYKRCCLIKEEAKASEMRAVLADIDQPRFTKELRRGYEEQYANHDTKACDIWLPLWQTLLEATPTGISIRELDSQLHFEQFISNWVQDLEMSLGNAGLSDPLYHHKRIEFCQQFNEHFIADWLTRHNMRLAIGLSYAGLKMVAEAESVYESALREFPNSVWPYIYWSEIYETDCCGVKDLAKTRALLEKALTRAQDEMERTNIEQRIEDLALPTES